MNLISYYFKLKRSEMPINQINFADNKFHIDLFAALHGELSSQLL